MWRTGLVAPWHVGSSWTRARSRVPCIDKRILNHCATREALCVVFSFVDLPQFVHFTVDRHLSSLQFEAISNSAAMKIFVHVKYVCIFVGYLPRHGMSG